MGDIELLRASVTLRGVRRTVLWATLALSLIGSASPGDAQQTLGAAPPAQSSVDANGVDLVTGLFNLTTQDLSIGPPGAHALNYSRTFLGIPPSINPLGQYVGPGWTDNTTGTIYNSGTNAYTVSFGGESEVFFNTSGVWVPQNGHGSTLTYNSAANTYLYTLSSGVAVVFSGALASQYSYPIYGSSGRPVSATWPDGYTLTYTYQTTSVCVTSCPAQMVSIFRLSSVNDNLGYQLKFTFLSNTATSTSTSSPWSTIASVTAINNAIDYCSPTANSCSGFSTSWPIVNYAAPTSTTWTTTDPLGRTTTYTHDGNGEILGIRRPSSSTDTSTITYLASDQVKTASNEIGTWSYAYAINNSIPTTTVTDPLTHTRVAVGAVTGTAPYITANGELASDTDGLGRKTSYLYDNFGRTTQVTRPEGDETIYAYDARGNTTQVTRIPSPGSTLANIVTSSSFDTTCTQPAKCNSPNSTTNAMGAETDYTYDPTYGVPLTVTSPAPTAGATRPQTRYGYTSLYAWYKNGSGTIAQASTPVRELTSTSSCQTLASCAGAADEVKGTSTYGVSGTANNLEVTATSSGSGDGALTATTSFTYDSVGNQLTIQSPLGANQIVLTRYDAARQVIGVVGPDPDGSGPLPNPAKRYTYNLDGKTVLSETGTVLSQSNSDWANFSSLTQVATTYDIASRSVQNSLSGSGTLWSVAQTTYDNANNITCVARRMNPAAFGSLPTSACQLGAPGNAPPDLITHNSYDAAGQLIQVTNGYGTASPANYATFTYSPNGAPLTIVDANTNKTTDIYDGFDRVSQVQYPLPTLGSNASNPNDYEAFSYQADGNVVSKRLRSGDSIAYSYDALGRRTLKHFSAGAEQDVYYGYDLLGRRIYANYGSATGPGITDTWDALSRQKTTASLARTLSYQYDLAGNRTAIAWPDSGSNALTVGYTYDNLNRVTAVEENGATSGPGLLATFAYDAMGERHTFSRAGGAGATTLASDDGAGRLASLSHTFANAQNNVAWTFAYTPADQLVSALASSRAYDFHPPVLSKSYTANGLNQYTAVGGATFSSDSRGNLLSDGTRAFTYDLENHLLTASAPTPVSLTYDPLGRLQTSAASGVTTTFLYAGNDLVGEYSGSTILRRYVPGPDVDEPLVWYEGAGVSGRRWLHADREGSIIAWSDAGGNLGAAFGYSPYGEPSSWTGSRFAYTGQITIPEAQLYHYKSRVYDPGLGRFLQTDTIGYASDVNYYAYVHNDPVNGIDPSGTQCGITIDIPSRPDLPGGAFSTPDCDNTTVGLGGASADSPMPSFQLASFIKPGLLSPQNNSGCNTTNTNGSVQDRAGFFSHLSELRNVAQALNVPENYIVGLASYESGWLDAHNVGLNNLWGLTQAGGNNIHFSSFAAGDAYFVSHVGPYIRNANTLAAFDQGLMNEGYNSANPNYWSALNGRINSIPKWEGRCGVQ